MNPLREVITRLPGHWYKGGYGDGKGNYCGVGHLSEYGYNVGSSQEEMNEAFKLMNEVAFEQYPERATYVINFGSDVQEVAKSFANFNDHPDTTEEEVIAVMEKAAVRFEERL